MKVRMTSFFLFASCSDFRIKLRKMINLLIRGERFIRTTCGATKARFALLFVSLFLFFFSFFFLFLIICFNGLFGFTFDSKYIRSSYNILRLTGTLRLWISVALLSHLNLFFNEVPFRRQSVSQHRWNLA